MKMAFKLSQNHSAKLGAEQNSHKEGKYMTDVHVYVYVLLYNLFLHFA